MQSAVKCADVVTVHFLYFCDGAHSAFGNEVGLKETIIIRCVKVWNET